MNERGESLVRAELVTVTSPLKVPWKITPLGTPFSPLPVTVKLPPPAKMVVVTPVVELKLELISAPVLKLRLPRVAIGPLGKIDPPPFRPSIWVSLDLVRVTPLLLTLSVPPRLSKIRLLSANAAIGKASISKAIHTIRLIGPSLLGNNL